MGDLRIWMAILFILGLSGLGRMVYTHRLKSLRSVDVLQLIASIACLGVAVTLLVITLRRR
jgi:hypothetical protein